MKLSTIKMRMEINVPNLNPLVGCPDHMVVVGMMALVVPMAFRVKRVDSPSVSSITVRCRIMPIVSRYNCIVCPHSVVLPVSSSQVKSCSVKNSPCIIIPSCHRHQIMWRSVFPPLRIIKYQYRISHYPSRSHYIMGKFILSPKISYLVGL